MQASRTRRASCEHLAGDLLEPREVHWLSGSLREQMTEFSLESLVLDLPTLEGGEEPCDGVPISTVHSIHRRIGAVNL